jgi:hypothetical protein
MMGSLWQNILAFALVGMAVVYVIYSLYRRFFSKKKTSPCDDCEGCALKEQMREKKCPKGLFPSN